MTINLRKKSITLLSICVLVACGGDKQETDTALTQTYFGVTAHRGDSFTAPENTIRAFTSAIEANTDWAELDVYRTADNRLVVTHDASTVRVTGIDMSVNTETYERLASLDAASDYRTRNGLDTTDCPPARMPLLSEVLELFAEQRGTRVSIQPKDNCTADAVRMVEHMGLVSRAGFNDGSLEKMMLVKSMNPAIHVFWDRPADCDVKSDLAIAREHGFESMVIHYSGITAEKVALIHEAGLEAGAWTVNDPKEMLRLLDMGVDRIYTDNPRLLISIRVTEL